MKRRDFLKSMMLGTAGLTLPVSRLYAAANDTYTGRLLVLLQVTGGWDVTSFCDPKVNQAGEQEITHWSNSAEILTAGNIPFAPFASNADFFNKYHPHMVVINGVDAQTNSHSTGVLHNWSGRNSEGFPSLTAMFAAHNAPEQPLSYINNGGYGQTANLIRFSRLDDTRALTQILQPEYSNSEDTIRRPEDMARIREYRLNRMARLIDNHDNTPRRLANLEAYENALQGVSALTGFSDFIPEDIFENEQINNQTNSDLRRQIQMAVAAFDAGIASAADLIIHGFDTHDDHDNRYEPLLAHTTDSLDMLWTLAEERGFADRLTVVIGSDFGRTPFYNADEGKDHWPIGSVVVMEQNPSWGNRVIGLTDEGHNAYAINPITFERDDENGTIIYPKHVHKALRRHLGLENTAVDEAFQFTNTEDFAIFS